MKRPRFTPKFADALIARLKAGEDPQALSAELNIGPNMMRKYVAHAKARVA